MPETPPTTPFPDPALPQPERGGCFIREPDDSLVPDEEATTPNPAE